MSGCLCSFVFDCFVFASQGRCASWKNVNYETAKGICEAIGGRLCSVGVFVFLSLV